ncbi:DUF461 domain-containing protein [Streptomyces solincola]|uniref:DUF461 domain-containing protein n=1 Tax=Streptomyces solincola TaxID=2100817 RepID=A0A2S9PWC6_9ACTN|nr:DUF461 domain-containing protein [Streptomyces solincola]PRH78721.1 DUF461 domain-containing protein [Streptomyces solincola]
MSRSLRRGALAATAIVFSIASLAACGAGNDAQTLGVRPDNAAATVGNIQIQNVAVVTQPERDAAGPAVVTAKIFNNGSKPETLDEIALPGANAPVKLSAPKGGGKITVPAGGSVLLGGEGNASAVIDRGREATRDGDNQEIVFTLSETGDVKMKAAVTPATSYFSGFGPSQMPKLPSPQPSSPSGSPSSSVDPAVPIGQEQEEEKGEAQEGGAGAPNASDSASASEDAQNGENGQGAGE